MRSILFIASALALSMAASAQSAQDHAAHHPEAASAAKAAPARPAAPAPGQMEAQMKSMREMHDKMMAARTPEERQALMAEHMKAMQDGMAMMGRMKDGKPGGMSMNPETMGKRMDMMEMMMQMMMDREADRPPAGR
jgi:hypothetical protein